MPDDWADALDPGMAIIARGAEMLARASSVEEFDHTFEVVSGAVTRAAGEQLAPPIQEYVDRLHEAAGLDDMEDRQADVRALVETLRRAAEERRQSGAGAGGPAADAWLDGLDPGTRAVANAAVALRQTSSIEGFDATVGAAVPIVAQAVDAGLSPAAAYLIRRLNTAAGQFDRIEDRIAVVTAALGTVRAAVAASEHELDSKFWTTHVLPDTSS